MKIAVPTEHGQIFQHFGKCPSFTVYETDGQVIRSKSILDTNGSGHSALADLLAQNQVNLLICGGIGQGAKDALAAQGIQLICGVTGLTDMAVDQYLHGMPMGNPDFVCDHHHEHEEGHSCHC